MTLADFGENADGELVPTSVTCPIPYEVDHGKFDNADDLVRHLLNEHEPWELAVIASRLTIEVNLMHERITELYNGLGDAPHKVWFPDRMEDDSLGPYHGSYMVGLVKPAFLED